MPTEDIYKTIGKRISELRKERNVTQEELAKGLHLARTSISNIESGKQKMLVHTLLEIAALLHVNPIALLPSNGGASLAITGESNISERDIQWLRKQIED